MVQGVDDVGDVFTHIAADIVLAREQFRRLVDQVRRDDAVDQPVLIGLVKGRKPVREQPEGGHDKNAVGPAFF